MTTECAGRHRTASESSRPIAQVVGRWLGPAILVAIGLAGLVGSLLLGILSDGRPGPGLWPLIVSSAIIVCGVSMGPQDDVESVTAREFRVMSSAVLLLAAFVVMFNLIGIFFPTLIVLFVWFKFISRRGWIQSLVIAAATGGALYLIFTYVFGVGN
jgi:uncharacterized membrane protein